MPGTVSRPRGLDRLSAPLDARSLRLAMQTALLAPLTATGSLALATGPQVDMGATGLAFVGLALVTALATWLPWARLLGHPWGMPAMYAWTAANIFIVTVGIWAAGGSRPELMVLYALTTVFSAAVFRPRAQLSFLVLTLALYGTVLGLTTGDPLPLAVLAVLAVLANFLVREAKRQMAGHREAREESDRRLALLATVAAAVREISTAESGDLLRVVIDAARALGYEATRIHRCSEGRGDDVTSLLSSALADVPGGIEPVPTWVLDEASEHREPIVVTDRAEVRQELKELGLGTVVTVPILLDGSPAAALVIVSAREVSPPAEDVEVFRMLAAQAGHALENAQRLELQRRTIDRMAELDGLKNDFLSNVSHELRTPLTVIRGMGRTLQERWPALSEEDRDDLLARLNSNAVALDTIIGELLDFARLEAGRLQVRVQEFHMESLISGVVSRLQSLFETHTVQVEVDHALKGQGDPILLERVLENLLSNAAKHTPAGSSVRITGRADGDGVVVAVEDDGPGIPREELAHLGERFFRGGHSHTRRTRGTGLGLAIVSEILDMHGSLLEVESDVDKGSSFSFRLPPGVPVVGIEEMASESPRVVDLTPGWTEGILQGERFGTVLNAAKAGLEWAITTLYRELHPRVLRYLWAQAPSDAEAIASSVWEDVAAGLATFEGDERVFRRWVFRLARRRILAREGEGSERDRPPIGAFEATGNTGEAPNATSGRREEVGSRDVLTMIRSLSPEQADAVLLHAVGGFDVDDMASITGREPGLVHALKAEGLKRLRSGSAALDAPVGR